MFKYLLIFLVILLCPQIYALDINFLPHWEKEGRISYASSSGNTDDDELSIRIKVNKPKGNDRFFSDLEYYLESEDGDETENELTINLRYEHTIRKKLFYFINGYYKRDEFSGTLSRTYAGPGLGYTLIDTDKHNLQILDSLNYEYESIKEKPNSSNVNNVLRIIYTYNIYKNIEFSEEFSYDIAFNNTDRYFVDSESSLDFKINKHLSIVFNYIVEYQNIIPEDEYKHTDKKFLVSLAFKF
ncbi:MAG: DUF481 domain-containing protein [Deferribacterota bacterium]|nr:DUF481 domain-containing protein [Deferribacterota bacterium]